MVELRLSGFALDVTGLISSRPRREMENQYYQNKDLKELTQPAASIPLAYEKEFSPEDKEKIFKDIYSIKAWQRLCEFFQSQKEN